jgi:hypothetical protein
MISILVPFITTMMCLEKSPNQDLTTEMYVSFSLFLFFFLHKKFNWVKTDTLFR